MSRNDTGNELRRADEIAWRHVWLANVMVDSGKPPPSQIPRHKLPMRRPSLSRRLHRLHQLRVILGPPWCRMDTGDRKDKTQHMPTSLPASSAATCQTN